MRNLIIKDLGNISLDVISIKSKKDKDIIIHANSEKFTQEEL